MSKSSSSSHNLGKTKYYNMLRYSYVLELFNPRNVAIIGASHHEGKIGYTLLKNIVLSGYRGKIYPVNPNGGEILGQKVYKSLNEINEDIDLSLVVVPANVAINIFEDIAKKSKYIVVITSGFSEIGNIEGEKILVEKARKYGARILGPNVFGIYSSIAPINATFGPSEVRKGNIAIVSQSGALGIAMIGKTTEENIGLSAIVSLGNKSDIDEIDILSYLFKDKLTKVIFLYIEGLKNGREFLRILSKKPEGKKIIVLKSGRSKSGAKAVASHTGSLAGNDAIFSAALRQAGVLRADSLEDGFNWVTTIASSVEPAGENIVIVTNGGGLGVIAADACEKYGLHLFDDMDILKKTFQDVIPPFGSYRNPVDVTGQSKSEDYKIVLERAFQEESIHSILALYCEAGDLKPEDIEKAIMETHPKYKKPALYAIFGGKGAIELVKSLNRKGIPAFGEVEDAVSSLYALYKVCEKHDEEKIEEVKINEEKIKEIIEKVKREGRNKLLSDEAKEIISSLNIDIPPFRIAKNINEAISNANKIGYPVVMKVISEDIIHKTDIGGVVLNIDNEREVVDAYEAIMENCKRNVPKAKIRGVEISKMVEKGVETIVGISTDDSFGKILMFGLGGIYVEVIKDVSFRIAPVSKNEIKKMIKEIESYPLLEGIRGEKRKDIESIIDIIYKIGILVTKFDEIQEIDINPLMVYEKGAKAVDARISIR